MAKLNLDKLKKLRKKNKLSQSEMAELLGMKSLYPYHRKESGNQPFKAEEIIEIANYFNVEIEYFFVNEVAKNAINEKEVI
ncbi:helix-turn-helix transcriptional regulator [Halobacillus sp. A5]|uniref:helix-turn-helix domain-containing protein n=1 Tax=Halobacillus sp. A5 TaxID=2880263 RepID=UPI0020A65F8F|nr:helix-turn-helix transcriptional regulator [Halobacillus sp. A5]MCP3026645.1 helix-turn-helix domain-containing protein [Halobacillus sp. A5]